MAAAAARKTGPVFALKSSLGAAFGNDMSPEDYFKGRRVTVKETHDVALVPHEAAFIFPSSPPPPPPPPQAQAQAAAAVAAAAAAVRPEINLPRVQRKEAAAAAAVEASLAQAKAEAAAAAVDAMDISDDDDDDDSAAADLAADIGGNEMDDGGGGDDDVSDSSFSGDRASSSANSSASASSSSSDSEADSSVSTGVVAARHASTSSTNEAQLLERAMQRFGIKKSAAETVTSVLLRRGLGTLAQLPRPLNDGGNDDDADADDDDGDDADDGDKAATAALLEALGGVTEAQLHVAIADGFWQRAVRTIRTQFAEPSGATHIQNGKARQLAGHYEKLWDMTAAASEALFPRHV